MAAYAGKGPTRHQPYKVGTLTDAIYEVSGGMEEWAYAASWEGQHVLDLIPKCEPNTYGGYPVDRCIYSSGTHRAPNFLVESSFRKQPPSIQLGSLGDNELDILIPEGPGDGHIPRNVRLALAALDFAQPYIEMISVSGRKTTSNNHTIDFSWRIGGAVHVDETQLFIAGPFPNCGDWNGLSWHQDLNVSEHLFIPVGNSQLGTGRWGNVPDPFIFKKTGGPFSQTQGVFHHIEHLSAEPGNSFAIVAAAQVDGTWNTQNAPDPSLPPQSHLVNARLNEEWLHTLQLPGLATKIIQGKVKTHSVIKCIQIKGNS